MNLLNDKNTTDNNYDNFNKSKIQDMTEINENIQVFIYEADIDNENTDLLDEYNINNSLKNVIYRNDNPILLINHYYENYTLKELLYICDYYGCSKEIKTKKFNKYEIIEFLVIYEMNEINKNIVNKRKRLWFYLNELKNDKFMKKFIIY